MSEKMRLFSGRPSDMESRLPVEQRVYIMLDSLGIEYHRVDHEIAMTMRQCEEIDRILGAEICKNLFLCNRQKTDFYLVMIKGEKHFKTKQLSAQINTSRLSFADGEYMERYLDLTPGSVSVLGLMNDKEKRVRLLVDSDLKNAEYIGCHPCINSSSLRIKTEDLFGVFVPATGHDAAYVELKEEDL